MKTNNYFLHIILTILLCFAGTNTYAYDIAVENADGVTIYYNYINNGTELEVAGATNCSSIVIPEDVTYMNRTRKVTSIGDYAFAYYGPNYVTLPNSVIYIKEGAFVMSGLLSINLPNSLTYIGDRAFQDCGFTTISIPNSVNTIETHAFLSCDSLKNVSIGNSVTKIGDAAFSECDKLEKVIIKDISAWCNIEFGDWYANPTVIAHHIYSDENNEIIDLYIPNGVTSIRSRAFYGCSNLKSVTIPNGVTTIDGEAFASCIGLTSIIIPNSVSSIGWGAFRGVDFTTIVSQIENPNIIIGKESNSRTFSLNTYNNATLYVPVGTIDKYKSTEGWKDFLFIEEGTGGTPTIEKCEKPTITYNNGKLFYYSNTSDAICQSTITDTDVASYSGNEVQLCVTYTVSVYATKAGYQNSETAVGTLCWIDTTPTTEGITGIAEIPANAVLIQANDGFISISGLDESKQIAIYQTDGKQVATAKAYNGNASVATNISKGTPVIVKIGEKAVKVVMQ